MVLVSSKKFNSKQFEMRKENFHLFLGWGGAIFLFGAVVLLLCDKESEEIYYKERKIVHESSVMRD